VDRLDKRPVAGRFAVADNRADELRQRFTGSDWSAGRHSLQLPAFDQLHFEPYRGEHRRRKRRIQLGNDRYGWYAY